MTKTMQGVIHGKTIELINDPGLADGEQVRVVIESTTPTYKRGERLLRCEGALAEKPKAVSYYNPLVAHGIAKENRPEEDRRQFVDIHGYYHIIDERDEIPSEVYVSGFMVETKLAGIYETKILFHTPEELGRGKLTILVEDSPTTRMRCARHKNCFVDPIATKEYPDATP